MANAKKVFTTFAQIQVIKQHFPSGVWVGRDNDGNHCRNTYIFLLKTTL
jgi:hypothetical protein